MSLNSFSEFYFGIHIDSTNNNINFDEGGGPLTATIATGSYSFTEFMSTVTTALDSASTLPQSYIVSFNRTSRIVTISSTSNFSLLLSSGTQIGTSPFSLLGFTQTSDLTGSNSYQGQGELGFSYRPQFMLQSYVDPEHSQEKISPSINESANGDIEVISFGDRKFIEFNILFITNIIQDNNVIKSNSTGIEDAVIFLKDIILKGKFEFMPDINNKNVFHKVLLESTAGSSKGVGYRLKEMVDKSLPNYFETGLIKLRVV